jgi:hypothetical protein
MTVGVGGGPPVGSLVLQVDPSTIAGTPRPVLASASLLLTVLFGGGALYRYGGRIDGAADASMASPLVSVVYGVMAYGLVGFLTAYAFDQLLRLGGGSVVATVLTTVFALAVFSLSGLGFAVVGVWVARSVGGRDPWLGLIGVGVVGALAWLLLPFLFGLLVTLAIAAVGVGGPTRQWVHGTTVEVEGG